MPVGPFHQWLYLRGPDGDAFEIFNGARTATYLANPALQLPSPYKISDVLDWGGCYSYAFDPPCDSDDAYIDFPGTGGNLVTVPDAAAFDIVGDITLIFDSAMDDWTPAADAGFIGKWTAAPELSYLFAISTTGFPYLAWTTNGTTANFITSTVAVTNPAASAVLNGDRLALRVDFDVNNGASGRTARFYWAATHEGPWTLLSTVTQGTATTIDAGTSIINLGNAGGSVLAGKMYYAQIRSGISTDATVGGAAVLTIDPATISDPAAVTFSAVVGGTATIGRSGGDPTMVSLGPLWWEPAVYSSPAVDDAPWYDSTIPESGDVLGFWITEWTGLDDRHVGRQPRRTGRPGGGAQLGLITSAERVMKLNVLVVGRSERAVEHAFRWLSGSLTGVCATCATSSALIRRFCPDYGDEDLWNGVAELREVGLIEGVGWEGDMTNEGGCFVRLLSFTLAAGDPCMYLSPTSTSLPVEADVVDCLAALPLADGKATCRPLCVDMPDECRTIFSFDVPNTNGAIAPVLTMENDSDHPVVPLRAICYGDPNDVGTSPNPCGLPILGEIYTQVIPPWTTIVWDVAARKVLYGDHTTVGLESGFRVMDAVDPPFTRFFALPCGTAHIVIEPANDCLTVDAPNSRYTYGGYTFEWSELHFPSMSVELQERLSCS